MFAATAKPRALARRGFTLVELLVVMSIMAILIALLVPVLNAVRRQMSITRTQASIDGISMAIETYRQVQNAYPPDKNPASEFVGVRCRSSECLVYYLSGGSIAYQDAPSVIPVGYPWQNTLYRDNSPDGNGRKAMTVYYTINTSLLKDGDGDMAPEVYDPWQKRIIYNTGSSTDGDYNQYGAAKHNLKKFDILSAGPDGVYGNDDDVTNYKDSLADDYYKFRTGDLWAGYE